MDKIISFIMSIIYMILSLFGLGGNKNKTYTEYLNLAYGSDKNQTLDLYLPKDGGDTLGLFLYIHGGAWCAGDKKSATETATYIAKDQKIAAVTMNYRLISEGGSVTYKDILDDVQTALTKIKETAAKDGITLKSAALCGDSAGGHISLLYTYKCGASSPIPIPLVISNAGPTNLLDPEFYKGTKDLPTDYACLLMSELCDVNIDPNNVPASLADPATAAALAAASPITYAAGANVVTLMSHGQKDYMVPYTNALALDKVLTDAGREHYFITYPNSGHDLANDNDARNQYNDKLFELAYKYLK